MLTPIANRRVLFRIGCCFVFLAVISAVNLQAAEPAYQVTVVTDREDAVYDAGAEAKFLIRVLKDGESVKEGTVSFVIDDFVTEYPPKSSLPAGTRELTGEPMAIAVTAEKPGFLRCVASYSPPGGDTIQAAAGAGFSPFEIGPSLPAPDDFDAFWIEQKRKLAEVPWEPTLTPVQQEEGAIECFDVQVPCLGDVPVSGYFAKPKVAAAKSLPAILWVQGAGVRSSILGNALRGAKEDMLSMDINAHGIPNGKPDEFYAELSSNKLNNYPQTGRESRETSYFRGMFVRLVRAIDFLTAQPEWDGEHLIVVGHSQGGGQALAAGGLDSRVTMIATGVPAICDHSGRAAGRVNGWPKLVPTREDGSPDPEILQATRYVDAVNFADRCQAEAIMSVGFIDMVCPPSTCYAAYNLLQGPKQVVNVPLMGHAVTPEIDAAFWKRILEHAGKVPVERAQ